MQSHTRNEVSMNIGKSIKMLLKKKAFNASCLARKLGVSRQRAVH
jgi:hypothetical protein